MIRFCGSVWVISSGKRNPLNGQAQRGLPKILIFALTAVARPGAPVFIPNRGTLVANSVGRCHWSSWWPPRSQERSQKQARRLLTPMNKRPTLNSPPVSRGLESQHPASWRAASRRCLDAATRTAGPAPQGLALLSEAAPSGRAGAPRWPSSRAAVRAKFR